MIELIDKRTEYGKTFNLGNKEEIRVFNKPIHFLSQKGSGVNPEKEEWENIQVKLNLLFSSKDYNSHYLSDKQKYSYGFRNDNSLEKFYGIRKGSENQLEGTLKSIYINGDRVKLPTRFQAVNKIDDYSIENIINEQYSVYNQIDVTGIKSALKTSVWIEDFEIIERIDLKGFRIINQYTYNNGIKEYISENECFNIYYDNGEIITIQPASMWNDVEHCSNGINHRLIEQDGELLYIKTPNKTGKEWLLFNRPVFYIDISVYKSSYNDLEAAGNVAWSTTRGGDSITNTASSGRVGVASFDKMNMYQVWHAFFSFNLSSYFGETVSPKLNLYGNVRTPGSDYVCYPHNVNIYQASDSTSWTTETTNYRGTYYISNTSAEWLSADLNSLTLGGTVIYRLRDKDYDVANVAPPFYGNDSYGAYWQSQYTDAYISFEILSNAIFFGFNF